jgi:hypothetical protein
MQPFPIRHLRVLVGVSEIAELTDVSAAVVTNWRSRFETFPRPAMSGPRPQFDLLKVLSWLDSGEGPRGRLAPELPPETWWRFAVRAFLLDGLVPSPRETLSALLVLRHHRDGRQLEVFRRAEPEEPGDPMVRMLSVVAHEAEQGDERLRDLLVPALAGIDGRTALCLTDLIRVLFMENWTADALQQLETVLADDQAPAGPARTTTASLAALMAALSGVRPDDVVFDPACGEGAALLACARLVDGRVSLHGQELDDRTARIARSRLAIARLDADIAPPGHDSLRDDQFPGLLADVVVLDPPVNEQRAPLTRWIPHALSHVKPSGRAVIALPLSALIDVKAARRGHDKRLVHQIGELAAEGRLHAAVVLPRGHRGDVVGPIVLVVLAGADARLEHDRHIVMSIVDTRDPSIHEDELVPLIASYVRNAGPAALLDVPRSFISSDRVPHFGVLLTALQRAGEDVESTISTGPRRSSKRHHGAVEERVGADSLRAFDLPSTTSVSMASPSLRSVTQAPASRRSFERDVRDLLALLERLRPLIEDKAYKQLRDAMHQVSEHLDDEVW